MRKAEIDRKFDEIVAFAEVEKFLDTPVKRYSSGMYVRLAFAVAAHLEPEILIVDEVLAVGDAAFQKKCLGKMGVGRRRRADGAVRQPQHGGRFAALRASLVDGSGSSETSLIAGESRGGVSGFHSPGSAAPQLSRSEGTGPRDRTPFACSR